MDELSYYLIGLNTAMVTIIFIIDPNMIILTIKTLRETISNDMIYRAIGVMFSLFMTALTFRIISKIIGGR